MNQQTHYRRLESMYLAAPINQFYQPAIRIDEAWSEIRIELSEKFFHAARAAHGSVYFKMLDDAAFFAASSLEQEYFVLTSSFTTYLLRPVASGILRAEGKVVNRSRTQLIAESIVYNEQNKQVGRGNGIFVKGRLPLTEAMGYDG